MSRVIRLKDPTLPRSAPKTIVEHITFLKSIRQVLWNAYDVDISKMIWTLNVTVVECEKLHDALKDLLLVPEGKRR